MNTTQIELAVLIAVTVLMTVTLWWSAHRLLDRLYERQVTIDKHAKAVARDTQRANIDAAAAVERADVVREDARLMLERVERHMSDPRVKRMLGEIT